MIIKQLILATAVTAALVGCSKPESDVAQTAAVQAAAPLQSGIEQQNFDQDVRVQDDFYHAINGTWLKQNPVPADRTNYGSFSVLQEEAEQALKKILLASAEQQAELGTDTQKIGDFWRAYMDEAAVEAKGLEALAEQREAIATATTHADLAAVMGQLLLDGVSMPFGFYVESDAKASDTYITYLYQAGLGLPDRDYYLKDDAKFAELRGQYVAHMAEYLNLAGIPASSKAAEGIMAIETALAEAQWTRVESRNADKTYNKVDRAGVQSLLGDFDWARFAAAAGMSDIDALVVRQPSYLQGFGKLFSETSVADWKAYLDFHLLREYADYLPKSFIDSNFAFFGKTLNGIEAQKPRWKKAVAAADQQVGELLGKLYVSEYFKPEAKARMEDLVQNLIKAFEVRIKALDWMGEETKQKALLKLSQFTPKIGYPEKWKDYTALEVKPDDLAGNYRRASRWAYQQMLGKLGQPIDRTEWLMTPQTINAYYHPLKNEIVFPAAILQPPFFNLDADDAVNYGGIGAVIGHEISHGFDDQGSKYAGDGNLSNWWTDADRKAFDERGKLLIKQYSAYEPLPGKHVNGRLTLGENIGDLGGLAVSLEAYRISLNGEKAPLLDGFSGEQRFFLGWAQVWRRNYRDEALLKRLLTDPHSPSQYRANGIVANMDAFYDAFEVKAADGMYIAPEQRVRIW